MIVQCALPGYPRNGDLNWGLELLHYAGRWGAGAFRKILPVAD